MVLAKLLQENGVVVLPVDGDPASIKTQLKDAAKDAPEFTTRSLFGGPRYLGFPAHSYPSAFHAKAAWWAREKVFEALCEHLSYAIGRNNVAIMHDRFKVGGMSTTRGPFHRDQPPVRKDMSQWGCTEGDQVYQCIYNIGTTNQYFSCWKGSHKLAVPSPDGGFLPCTEEEMAQAKANRTIITVKPGEVLVFDGSLMHEVYPQPEHSDRVWVGLHITPTTQSFAPLEDMDRIFDETVRAVPRLPSGQEPAMYSRLHVVCHPDKLETFAKNMNPNMITHHTYKTGTRAGKSIRKPYRYSKSMAQRNLPTDLPHLVKLTLDARKFYTPSRGPWKMANGNIIPALK